MLSLAEQFVARGAHCDLVIAITKGQLLDYVPDGVRLIKLNKHKTIHALFALIQYLRCERPTAMLATVFTANICALLAGSLSFTRTKIVICEAAPTGFYMRGERIWKTIANKIAARILYRRADEIIAVSKGVRSSLLEENLAEASRIHVVYNPILELSQPTKPLRRTLDRPIIVACGRLEPAKDYPTLLRAFARLRQTHDAKLVILGEGSLHHALNVLAIELGVEKDVTLVGFVHDPRQYMKKATVFAHSASHEGFGLVLLEALAAGCPIVATDCPGGVREVLADGKFGTLVPVGDDQKLAKAIKEILTKRVKFPDATEYLKRFNIERIAASYISILLPSTPSLGSNSSHVD